MDNLSLRLVFVFKIESDIHDSNYINLKFHPLDFRCWLIMQYEKSVHTDCHEATHTHDTTCSDKTSNHLIHGEHCPRQFRAVLNPALDISRLVACH